LTAIENVMLPMLIDKKIDKQQRVDKAKELLDLVGLNNRDNHFPKELSQGEQQRVAIARSLANDPQIILADEPTGNIDADSEILIFEP
jgi:ABC-type lipoprotein export system ATPase subunit